MSYSKEFKNSYIQSKMYNLLEPTKSFMECRAHIYKKLVHKYSKIKYTLSYQRITILLYHNKSRFLAKFKDHLIYDDKLEFLRKYYKQKEIYSKLSKYTLFYHLNNKIYPNYITIPENIYLYLNNQKKIKMINSFNKMKTEEQLNLKNSKERKKNNKKQDVVFTDSVKNFINKDGNYPSHIYGNYMSYLDKESEPSATNINVSSLSLRSNNFVENFITRLNKLKEEKKRTKTNKNQIVIQKNENSFNSKASSIFEILNSINDKNIKDEEKIVKSEIQRKKKLINNEKNKKKPYKASKFKMEISKNKKITRDSYKTLNNKNININIISINNSIKNISNKINDQVLIKPRTTENSLNKKLNDSNLVEDKSKIDIQIDNINKDLISMNNYELQNEDKKINKNINKNFNLSKSQDGSFSDISENINTEKQHIKIFSSRVCLQSLKLEKLENINQKSNENSNLKSQQILKKISNIHNMKYKIKTTNYSEMEKVQSNIKTNKTNNTNNYTCTNTNTYANTNANTNSNINFNSNNYTNNTNNTIIKNNNNNANNKTNDIYNNINNTNIKNNTNNNTNNNKLFIKKVNNDKIDKSSKNYPKIQCKNNKQHVKIKSIVNVINNNQINNKKYISRNNEKSEKKLNEKKVKHLASYFKSIEVEKTDENNKKMKTNLLKNKNKKQEKAICPYKYDKQGYKLMTHDFLSNSNENEKLLDKYSENIIEVFRCSNKIYSKESEKSLKNSEIIKSIKKNRNYDNRTKIINISDSKKHLLETKNILKNKSKNKSPLHNSLRISKLPNSKQISISPQKQLKILKNYEYTEKSSLQLNHNVMNNFKGKDSLNKIGNNGENIYKNIINFDSNKKLNTNRNIINLKKRSNIIINYNSNLTSNKNTGTNIHTPYTCDKICNFTLKEKANSKSKNKNRNNEELLKNLIKGRMKYFKSISYKKQVSSNSSSNNQDIGELFDSFILSKSKQNLRIYKKTHKAKVITLDLVSSSIDAMKSIKTSLRNSAKIPLSETENKNPGNAKEELNSKIKFIMNRINKNYVKKNKGINNKVDIIKLKK